MRQQVAHICAVSDDICDILSVLSGGKHKLSYVAGGDVEVILGDNLNLPQSAGQRARQHLRAHLHRLLRPSRVISTWVVEPEVKPAAELLKRPLAIGKSLAPHRRKQEIPAQVRQHRGQTAQRETHQTPPPHVLCIRQPHRVGVEIPSQRGREQLAQDNQYEPAEHRRQLTKHPRVRRFIHPPFGFAPQSFACRRLLGGLHAPRRVRRALIPRFSFGRARLCVHAEERRHRGVPLGLWDDDGRAAVAPAHQRVLLRAARFRRPARA